MQNLKNEFNGAMEKFVFVQKQGNEFMQRILSPKTEFSNFLKKLDYYYALCSRDYENDNDLLTFSEDSCLGKIRF